MIVLTTFSAEAQNYSGSQNDVKPVVDSSVYAQWPSVSDAKISNNGEYVYYTIKGNYANYLRGILKRCKGTWEMVISDNVDLQFTSDSKNAFFLAKDTLVIIKMDESLVEKVPMVKSVQAPSGGDGTWIACTKTKTDDLILRNFHSGITKTFKSVKSFIFSRDGERLALQIQEQKSDTLFQLLELLNLSNGKATKVWENQVVGEVDNHSIQSPEKKHFEEIKSFLFSENGKFLVFRTQDNVGDTSFQVVSRYSFSNGKTLNIWRGIGGTKFVTNSSASEFAFVVSNGSTDNKSIWYVKENRKPVLLLNTSPSIGSSLLIDDISHFSSDGTTIFFTAKAKKKRQITKDTISTLTIWSYLDERLQSVRSKFSDDLPIYSLAVNVLTRQVTELGLDNDWILDTSENEDVYLVQKVSKDADGLDWKWNSATQNSYFIRSISKGLNAKLSIHGMCILGLSPKGKFVIYYDDRESSYFSYEVSTGIYRNISSEVHVSWINSFKDDLSKIARGISGWLSNDEGVFIYDKFDIWLIDPMGRKPPRNVTNGYGLKHNIVFSMGLVDWPKRVINQHDTLLLNALNLDTKENGYFQKVVDGLGDPVKLTMGNYIYQLINNPYVTNAGAFPLKARDEKRYVILRMSAEESPNYFFTDDFKTFTPLSSVYPERKFNWYRTELHSWSKSDGGTLQGVLYKPENFDSHKAYPVIISYYERQSFTLNEYLMPEDISNTCNINIPTFVSNGYLVFVPDIEYVIGDPMQGTLDAVVSAANYLSGLPFVDRARMGIGGCSFGGIQTNYLITHTKQFAAAYSSSSMSDFISAYGSTIASGEGLHNFFESGQGRMGGSLWDMPEKYIKNSPIFNADKVSTPLLLMHTRNDGICSFSQALEFYLALRRLGKRVWLLEYLHGNHGVFGESAKDFGIRLSQFFDHYLKDKPAPLWMTHRISVKEMDDNDYKLDYQIRTPGEGLIKDSSVVGIMPPREKDR